VTGSLISLKERGSCLASSEWQEVKESQKCLGAREIRLRREENRGL